MSPPPPALAPSDLTAVAGNARVALAWQPVNGATSYAIFRAEDGVWESSPLTTTSKTTFTNSTLDNGTLYSYRVAALNKGGSGPESAVASAMPLAPPGGFGSSAGDRQVMLNWQGGLSAREK